MRRVAVGNNKGGSGKTAATVNLAAALAEAGHRVLIVDMDPQANASRRLGHHFDPAAPVPTTCEVVADGTDGIAVGAIRPADWPAGYGDHIDVIPSRFDLENRVSEAAVLGAHARLSRALAGTDDGHAVTLIDCPPSLGHLTQLALAAADLALVTVEPEYDSVEGAVRFRDFLAGNAAALGVPNLHIAGYVVSRVRSRVGAHAFQLDGLADTLAGPVWQPHIPERAAIKDAADTAVPLRTLGGPVAASLADIYAELADRLVKELSA